ncbi:DUF262 domain-containing HNH endonuclease family protein [Chryseobacterium sp. RG1]|uniref:DUF262 domain-containing HNH endonuclease family protein n=1 Tax=Chryseobacterium tagetis TaxID=2801334 RepID=A0ABS7ZXW7_9FLAO|nr:DUF262 domain-containing protein [Chryseobacterium tagetis]MCA6066568.1 DUF262 domain-containing HNH endonuclease family protein [Chryseobacterium tagetis]
MEIDAQVKSISKLKDYFFIVPDYQREYVWKPEDQVEQFLIDIDNEYDEDVTKQKGYFIGSIIIVANKEKFDVIDGQQRLTTIILTLCAFRDLLQEVDLDRKQEQYLKNIEELLSDFDMDSDETQMRLELQYEESKGYLESLISKTDFTDLKSPSIIKMEQAYYKIKNHLETYLNDSVEAITNYAKYFLTKIELVLIESENLSSALKIFETINQRGAGLNAMDLVKNLLFSKAKPADFNHIKDIWKDIVHNLQKCKEDNTPLRFLRYFLMSRYYDGILREDDIYKWFLSERGRNDTKYETQPLIFAKELKKMSKRYSDLVIATELVKDGGEYPNITNIGFINKYKSRQHLILLMALNERATTDVIEYLGKQIESFFFYSVSLGIQAKNNENQFTRWAIKLRNKNTIDEVAEVIEQNMVPYIKERLGEFLVKFPTLTHYHYSPLYRERYVLGMIENTILSKSNFPIKGKDYLYNLQIEHILPQTPKNDVLTEEFESKHDYSNYVYRLGNVTLIESTINQAVNNFNDLSNDWFEKKQNEYKNSGIISTQLLDDEFQIGANTAVNRFKSDYGFEFKKWDKESINQRQEKLLNLVFETWKFNNKPINLNDQ